jgi:hypothetical protein
LERAGAVWNRPSAPRRTLADVSATTDVILAAGPTVVALAAIGSGAWQQKRGFSHERVVRDIDHVRGLLDDAAMALHRASYARDDVMRAGPAVAGKTEGVAAKIAATGTTLDELADRLAVRFGPDADATTKFREAADALRAIDIEIGRPEGFDIVEQFQAYQSASGRFDAARAAFLAVAAKTAGVELP